MKTINFLLLQMACFVCVALFRRFYWHPILLRGTTLQPSFSNHILLSNFMWRRQHVKETNESDYCTTSTQSVEKKQNT